MSITRHIEVVSPKRARWALAASSSFTSVASVLVACAGDDGLSHRDSQRVAASGDTDGASARLGDLQPGSSDVVVCSRGGWECAEVASADTTADAGRVESGGPDMTYVGLRIEPPLIRVGEFGRFRVVSESGESAPVAVEWTTDAPERLDIAAATGLGRAMAPGIVTVIASHDGGETALTIEVGELDGLGTELLSVSPMNLGVAAAQGLLNYDGTTFTAFNSVERGPCVAAIDAQLDVTREDCSAPPGWPGAHIGSPAGIGTGLMLPYMHLVAPPLTGLRVLDRDTFATTAWYDTSERYPYLDAIDVADGHLWLDVFQVFVRVPLTGPAADSPDFDAAVVFRRSVAGVLQGLRVRDGRLWAMAESTSTHPSLLGLHAYDLTSLEPESTVDFAATLNPPSHVWRFGYPTAEPDHEGFDFDPGATAQITFPVIPTNQVHRLALAGE